MEKKYIFMYSGQGAQYYQMGKDLFDNEPVFRNVMQRLDTLILERLGVSIIDVIYCSNKRISDLFDRTLYTSPAIFMVEYAMTQTLIQKGVKPDYLLGTSLGEYIMLAVANENYAEKILDNIIYKSRLLEDKRATGGMLAIFKGKNFFYENRSLFGKCEFASENFDAHFVVSGEVSEILKIESALSKANIVCQRIPVSIAFHSSGIECIEKEFKERIKDLDFSYSTIPVISCAYKQMNPRVDPQYLWDVLRKPIYFKDTIERFGVTEDHVFVDLGPSGTLSTFVNYCLKNNSKSHSIIAPSGNNKKRLEQIIESYFSNNNKDTLSNTKESKCMKAFIFPGQGSQKKGMGKDLFNQFSELTEKANEILGYSIKELCLNDPNNQLVQTQYAQVALYFVNAMHYYKRSQQGETVNFLAGHSLGEYNALLAAGAFDFETGLKLVQKRGLIMAQAKEGGMAAVVGLTEEKIHDVIKSNSLITIDIANLNSPFQTVISGPKADILKAQSYFEKAGAAHYLPLNVSGAFHSRYMGEGAKEFGAFLKNIQINPLKIPVISNVFARPYQDHEIKNVLESQITQSVKWCESIRYLMGRGVTEFIELGESTVLTKMVQTIIKEAKPLYVHESPSEERYKKQEGLGKSSIQRGNSLHTLSSTIKGGRKITSEDLGSLSYKNAYNIKYAYAGGGMYKGIASSRMVIALAKAGMMCYFGSGGLPINKIEEEIKIIKGELGDGYSYGMNLVHNLYNPKSEEDLIDLYLRYGIKYVEASAFMQATRALVKFRLKGLGKDREGNIVSKTRIQAKVSRPEVAEVFLSPAPEKIVQDLLTAREITTEQAEWSRKVPLATDLCVEADSGGHTDRGVATVLIPSMARLRDEMMYKYGYKELVHLGAAGGIGTPESSASAFLLGADYILTGSINQCTVEAGTSDAVKDMIENINVQDTDYAPAGDMFELGAKVQVLRKGVFFSARANKLFELYKQYNSLNELDNKTKEQLEKRYFNRSFEEIFEDCRKFYPATEIRKAEENPKQKMAMVFKWYFGFSSRAALMGEGENVVNYQVHCGPALGAFNQWVKGSPLEKWRNRNVDKIAIKLLNETADFISLFYNKLAPVEEAVV